jgi:hypothetical protein
MNTASIAAAVATITTAFAAAYWLLSVSLPDQGLLVTSTAPRAAGFADALYFSVVTETTLGAGDIQALGFSRLLVCLQVFVGLALGGVVVARITSIHGRERRLLAHHIAGDWIETCRMPSGSDLVAFVTIFNSEDTIRYDGESFDASAKPLGFFRSELIGADKSIITFRYSNRESSTAYFSEGIVSLRFIENNATRSRDRRWIRYQATTQDFGARKVIIFEGVRATPEESAVFRGLDYQNQGVVIERHLARLHTTHGI